MRAKDLENLRNAEGCIDITQFSNQLEGGLNNKISLEDTDIFWKKDIIDSFSMLTEVLVSILARQIGFPCAKYDMATCNGEKGVISYSVSMDNLQTLSYNEFLNSHLPQQLKNNEGSTSIIGFYKILQDKIKAQEIDKNEANTMLKRQVEILLFDVMIVNTDRCDKNLMVLSDKKKIFKLAPVCDHEKSFFAYCSSSKIKEFLKGDNLQAKIKNKIINTNSYMVLNEHSSSADSLSNNLKAVRKTFPNLFKKTMDSLLKIDLEKGFETFETEQKMTLPEEYKEWIRLVFTERRKFIKESFVDTIKTKEGQKDLEIN
ncbi:MAG: hypothetical protein AB7S44_03005 [Spirochaetales bacterium]